MDLDRENEQATVLVPDDYPFVLAYDLCIWNYFAKQPTSGGFECKTNEQRIEYRRKLQVICVQL